MRATTVAATLLVLSALMGATNAAPAAGVRDDSILKLDLSPAGGSTYFFKCDDHSVRRDVQNWRGDELSRCGIPSLWENTNTVNGLQSTNYPFGGRVFESDTPLLP